MDTLEKNLPLEGGKTDEENGTNLQPQVEENLEAQENFSEPKTKEEVLLQLEGLAERTDRTARLRIDTLKQIFYKYQRAVNEERKAEFLQGGGEESEYKIPESDLQEEQKLKELLNIHRERRAIAAQELEKELQNNYQKKLSMIDRLKEMISSTEDFGKLYTEFKEIQQQWKEIKAVPQQHANELWDNYQFYSEQFYDIIKINNEYRDYDFRKNLEMKTALCEAAESLAQEEDVVSAFHQLQKFHQDWREIGPVEKSLREPLWNRFKEASSAVNRRHQEHFENLKAKEEENYEAKKALCEKLEAIDYKSLNGFKGWNHKTKEVLEIQKEWKTIGFAPKKHNVKIFERFRAACDFFFEQKSIFYREMKSQMEENLSKKEALCEEAEALKESTDWKKTGDRLIELQKEWKTIGPVSRKYSDSVWKRFISACDYFFEQRGKQFKTQREEEKENLARKTEVVNKIKELNPELSREDAVAELKSLMSEWNGIGFVPFKDKDKAYEAFRTAIDEQFERLNIDAQERKMESYKHDLKNISEGSKNKLYNERERQMRRLDRLRSDLQTYENNMGFLNVSSKGGGSLMREMERKINGLKQEIELQIKKIETIDKTIE